MDYKIQVNRKNVKVFHINMLKQFFEREQTGTEREEAMQCLDVICSLEENDFNDEKVMYNPLIVHTEFLQDVVLSEDLNEGQHSDIRNMLEMYTDVLTNAPGQTSLVVNDIGLKDRKAVFKKPYCLPFALRSKVKQGIDHMISAGIIEESQSPWAAPIVCVPKKDQTLRFCVDYRGPNSQTTFDPQPMSKIDDIMNRLSRAKFLSKIDLTKGYWQIVLSDQAKPISAFVTPFGQYQFRVMPFGMINSGASFVR